MAKATLLVVISTLCYFSVQATHYYELDLSEDDPPTPAAEIAFSQQYGPQAYSRYEQHARHRRQLVGNVMVYPGGESRRINFGGSPFFGSLSQKANSHGFTRPINYGGGATFTSGAGHGLSGKVNMVHATGGQASVRGQVGLSNIPNHQVSGWAQHSRNLDKNFHIVGRETNSAGLTYTNVNNGASAFVSGTHTPGRPDRGSVGGSIPLATGHGGKTRLEATGQTNFGHGRTPDHNVGLKLTHNFN